jgi:AcrR family transcriptional regulator
MASDAQTRRGGRTPKQDRSRVSLRRLLETAATMLENDGYADFTLQKLSKRAKVSIGSIYHLFDNKRELVREIQIQFLERIEQEHVLVINALRRQSLPLYRLIPVAVQDYGEYLRKNAGMLRVFMQIAPMDGMVASTGKKSFAQSVRDFELLILDRRDDIKHPNPDHAVVAAFNIMYATYGRYLGLGTTPDSMGEGDWKDLRDDISQMILAFLLTDPNELVGHD